MSKYLKSFKAIKTNIGKSFVGTGTGYGDADGEVFIVSPTPAALKKFYARVNKSMHLVDPKRFQRVAIFLETDAKKIPK